jgi:hypothetical protein
MCFGVCVEQKPRVEELEEDDAQFQVHLFSGDEY